MKDSSVHFSPFCPDQKKFYYNNAPFLNFLHLDLKEKLIDWMWVLNLSTNVVLIYS